MSTDPLSSTTPPRAPMLTLAQALERLVGTAEPFPAAEAAAVSTFDALGRVLAEDVRSALDVPPADNSAMDGYAMRTAAVPGCKGCGGTPAATRWLTGSDVPGRGTSAVRIA